MNATRAEDAGARLLGRFGRNILWGTAWGLGMGAVFCLIGLAIVAIRGPRVLHVYGITLQGMMVTYLAGGFGAGLVAGVARPLLRWRVAAIVVGIVGGTICYGAVEVAMTGPVGSWEASDWVLAVLLGTAAGSYMGNWIWEQTVEPTLPPPEPPPGPPPPRRPLGQWRPK